MMVNHHWSLGIIAAALASGRIEFTYHALNESMPARGLSASDVLEAPASASFAEPQNDEGTKWKVSPVVARRRRHRTSGALRAEHGPLP
jgi:hypothetical protein